MDENNLNKPNPDGGVNPIEKEMILINPPLQEPEKLNGNEKKLTDETKPCMPIEVISSSHSVLQVSKNIREREEPPYLGRLSGAGKKRMFWLIRQGYSREEARRLAVQPVFYNKRELGEEFNESGSLKPKARSDVTPRVELSTTIEQAAVPPEEAITPNNEVLDESSRNLPIVHSQQKVVILPEDYPNSHLTSDHLKEVLDLILRHIAIERTAKPRFQGTHFKQGYLIIICADGETVEWLKNLREKLVLRKGTQVQILDEFHLPKTSIATATFQDSKEDTNEFILQLIKAQNRNLDVDSWKILKRSENDSQTQIVFSIDPSSTNWLMSTGERISFKFGEVQVKLSTLALDITIDEAPNSDQNMAV